MTWESDLAALIAALKKKQTDALLKRLSASFILGYKRTGATTPVSQLNKNAVKAMTKEQLGYLMEFDQAIGETLEVSVKAKLAEGGGYKSVKDAMLPSIEEVFGKDGKVTIDRVGQTRKIVEIGKDGMPYWTEKPITRTYSASIKDYSNMLSRTTTHAAIEAGRLAGYKEKGIGQRYTAVGDERTRSAHMAFSGTIITDDNREEALSLLAEPNCRCRLMPYLDDAKYDTPQSVFEAEKEKAGLFWNDDKEQWDFQE